MVYDNTMRQHEGDYARRFLSGPDPEVTYIYIYCIYREKGDVAVPVMSSWPGFLGGL